MVLIVTGCEKAGPMASIRRRSWKSGGETRTAWVADYSDGAGKRRLKTFATKKAADAWLVQARGEVQRGVHTPESGSVTVATAAAEWLERCEALEREPQTIRTYRCNWKYHVEPLLGRERLSRLSRPRVERFVDELLRTRSLEATRKALTTLKMLLGEAYRRGRVAQNVARDVRIQTNGRHKERLEVGLHIPAIEEVRAMLDVASLRSRPLVALAILAGLRSSEIRALRWTDVDLERTVITDRQRADRWNGIGSPKSAASRRDIPMAPMLVNTLREWKLACPKGEHGLVCPNGAGNVENHGNIYNRLLAPLQIACGITRGHKVDQNGELALDRKGRPIPLPKYSLHRLRHFCASWLIEQEFSPKKVQSIMGHSSIQMTYDLYGHLLPDHEGDQARLAAIRHLPIAAGRDGRRKPRGDPVAPTAIPRQLFFNVPPGCELWRCSPCCRVREPAPALRPADSDGFPRRSRLSGRPPGSGSSPSISS
jgi:integrase